MKVLLGGSGELVDIQVSVHNDGHIWRGIQNRVGQGLGTFTHIRDAHGQFCFSMKYSDGLFAAAVVAACAAV